MEFPFVFLFICICLWISSIDQKQNLLFVCFIKISYRQIMINRQRTPTTVYFCCCCCYSSSTCVSRERNENIFFPLLHSGDSVYLSQRCREKTFLWMNKTKSFIHSSDCILLVTHVDFFQSSSLTHWIQHSLKSILETTRR